MAPFDEGYDAAMTGKPYFACPYLGDAKRAWQDGWHAGHEERIDRDRREAENLEN